MASNTFTADTSTVLLNPEMGMARLITKATTQNDLNTLAGLGYRVVVFRDNFRSWCTVDTVPAGDITTINTVLGYARTAGIKVAFCHMYEECAYDMIGESWCTGVTLWNGSHPSLARMLGHIAQLKTMFHDNADVLVAVHAGFLGMYGEWSFGAWKGESNPSAEIYEQITECGITEWVPKMSVKIAIRDALMASVHPKTPIAFRTYRDIATWYPTPLTKAQAFTGSVQSRVHNHNDGLMMGSADGSYWTPCNIFPYPGGASMNSADVTLANPLRAYHAAMAQYVSFGGEPVPGGELTGCANMRAQGATYAIRYLRDDWGTALWASWTTGGCMDEAKRLMGYRFQLDSISHADSVAAGGGTVDVTVGLRNVGWSRPQNERRLRVVLTNGGNTITAFDNRQLRQFPAQATAGSTTKVSVPIPAGAASGTWNVHIDFPDVWSTMTANAFKIQPANTTGGGASWDGTNYRWTTGTTLSKSA